MKELTIGIIEQLTDNNYSGGGGVIPDAFSYLKLKEKEKHENVTLIRAGCKIRLESGEFVDTYVIEGDSC